MPFFQEFKKFLQRGTVVDMAVGVILGASFTKIIDAFVNHIVMPPIQFLVGGIALDHFKIPLPHAPNQGPALAMDLGVLLSASLNFFIVSFAVFIVIKILNKLHTKTTIFTKKNCPHCKMEIPIGALRCGHCTTILEEQSR